MQSFYHHYRLYFSKMHSLVARGLCSNDGPFHCLGRRSALQSYRPSLSLQHKHNYSTESARATIEKMIKENDLVVFMKGSAHAPMCGFSKTVCQILNAQGVERYTTVNVLESEEIRNEIKKLTSWPTIPQVFVKGDFVGGCDIILEMYRSGELRKLLETNKIIPPPASEGGTAPSSGGQSSA